MFLNTFFIFTLIRINIIVRINIILRLILLFVSLFDFSSFIILFKYHAIIIIFYYTITCFNIITEQLFNHSRSQSIIFNLCMSDTSYYFLFVLRNPIIFSWMKLILYNLHFRKLIQVSISSTSFIGFRWEMRMMKREQTGRLYQHHRRLVVEWIVAAGVRNIRRVTVVSECSLSL